MGLDLHVDRGRRNGRAERRCRADHGSHPDHAQRVPQPVEGSGKLFAEALTDFWDGPFSGSIAVIDDGSFAVFVNSGLSDDRRVTLLDTLDGRVRVALTPELAERISIGSYRALSESTFRQILNDAGIALHDADGVFYFSETAKRDVIRAPEESRVRQLTQQDAIVFAEFQSAATEQDLDDAYVELDHWAVFGSFEGDRLVSAGSMYPWGGAAIADIGVLTLPEFRGRGHARSVVRASSRYAYAHDHDPQYRCQLDNEGSIAVAAAAGLTPFGHWQVVSPDAGT
jgi:GNAT superfamily N-acetyltransferase